MSESTITRAAERDLADMQAAYDEHRAEHHSMPASRHFDLIFATCHTCAQFKDHIARCEQQLTLLSGDEGTAEPLF